MIRVKLARVENAVDRGCLPIAGHPLGWGQVAVKG